MHCIFIQGYNREQCKEQAVEQSFYCDKHSKMWCCVCGAHATHDCPETSSLVCGAPLCDNCEEELSPQGCNTTSHCRKVDQKYTVWYMRDKNELSVSKDIYVNIVDTVIHQVSVIKLLHAMEKYKNDPEEFQKMLEHMIARKNEELYDYMKKQYPSSVVNHHEVKV